MKEEDSWFVTIFRAAGALAIAYWLIQVGQDFHRQIAGVEAKVDQVIQLCR